MKLDLVPGRFLRRYKRFFADVELADGEVVTAHCPNTGSMATLLREGSRAYLEASDNPRRKLPWTLTLLGVPRRKLAIINTLLPNRIVAEAVAEGKLTELAGYGSLRREVRYGRGSRIDLLLDDPAQGAGPCYVEIKSVTMASATTPGRGDFPDSRTERGKRHLEELTTLADQGVRVVQLFLLGRTDCERVGIAAEIDPEYAEALTVAQARGVEVLAYRARVTPRQLSIAGACPFDTPS